ncbi:uncharacterized protein A4U43_C02F2390 [Asparagus officinalis]|uniref:Uncharacterized protein n=1 Tax=Asparagus officinalis TaxID=4686 RepID=A0A5P1FK36_ASPOF|nr:uncharacterized protein A4U43_C02F2390 [Asparagus officinalis]
MSLTALGSRVQTNVMLRLTETLGGDGGDGDGVWDGVMRRTAPSAERRRVVHDGDWGRLEMGRGSSGPVRVGATSIRDEQERRRRWVSGRSRAGHDRVHELEPDDAWPSGTSRPTSYEPFENSWSITTPNPSVSVIDFQVFRVLYGKDCKESFSQSKSFIVQTARSSSEFST